MMAQKQAAAGSLVNTREARCPGSCQLSAYEASLAQLKTLGEYLAGDGLIAN
jgi:hypothetical protein